MSYYSSNNRSSDGGLTKSLVIAAIVGVLAIAFFVGLVSSYNYAVRSENAIIANRDNARNVLGQHAPRLREALGVTRLQAADLERLYTASNESRYGEGGAQAAFQFIQEQNPNLDQRNYGRIISMIEAGRTDFANEQRQQIDRVRNYRTGSQTFPRAGFLMLVGKPTPGFFEEYEKIVVSGHSDEAFKTGRDDGLDISNMR
jgi:hypothetical protein